MALLHEGSERAIRLDHVRPYLDGVGHHEVLRKWSAPVSFGVGVGVTRASQEG